MRNTYQVVAARDAQLANRKTKAGKAPARGLRSQASMSIGPPPRTVGAEVAVLFHLCREGWIQLGLSCVLSLLILQVEAQR